MVKVLDFWAQWCGPCRLMSPVVEDLAKTYNIEKVEVDENTELATQYNIKAIPTFVMLVDGKEVDRLTGAVSREKLEEWIKSYGG